MADGEELPDHDYASIYGHAALHARSIARLHAMIQRQHVTQRRLDAILRQGSKATPEEENTHAAGE